MIHSATTDCAELFNYSVPVEFLLRLRCVLILLPFTDDCNVYFVW